MDECNENIKRSDSVLDGRATVAGKMRLDHRLDELPMRRVLRVPTSPPNLGQAPQEIPPKRKENKAVEVKKERKSPAKGKWPGNDAME